LSEVGSRRVVFTPALVLAALFDPEARAHLNQWRDRAIIPVLNRELLLAYLRLLKQAGLEQEQIRHWTLWFTSPERAVYLSELVTGSENSAEICNIIAQAESAVVIQTEGYSGDAQFRIVSAA
jgi:hypothetical protein